MLLALYWIGVFIIFWAMIGYPVLIRVVGKCSKKQNKKDYGYVPDVTVMVVAHNEEAVIGQKLTNLTAQEYPADRIHFLVTSDRSTDQTNAIVEAFIASHPQYDVRLYVTKEHKGKTNAQNEAQKCVRSELLVMTDANSMFEKNAVRELAAGFAEDDISYVCGRLALTNEETAGSAASENSYWNAEVRTRVIESRVQTITAGNGAIYACRNAQYVDIDPLNGHDLSFPWLFAMQQKRAVCNPDAVAYEKAGETVEDEFKRKVRMFRLIFYWTMPSLRIFNIFRYRWFTVFFLGHRTCRYLLWAAHGLVLVTNVLLLPRGPWFIVTLAGQALFYLLSLLQQWLKTDSAPLRMCHYYTMTVLAEWVGAWKSITGRSRAVWDKAASTR